MYKGGDGVHGGGHEDGGGGGAKEWGQARYGRWGVFLRRGGAISSDRGVRIFFGRALWGGFFLARELQEVIGERRMNIIASNSKT